MVLGIGKGNKIFSEIRLSLSNHSFMKHAAISQISSLKATRQCILND